MGVLGGCSGFLESNDNALEVSGVGWSFGGKVSIVLESQRMVGTESGKQ